MITDIEHNAREGVYKVWTRPQPRNPHDFVPVYRYRNGILSCGGCIGSAAQRQACEHVHAVKEWSAK